MMPGIDGAAACRMIRSVDNINRETPIIGITAYNMPDYNQTDFDEIWPKPITTEMIARAIETYGLKQGASKSQVTAPLQIQKE
jgi:CheY-like chemotaxis protein